MTAVHPLASLPARPASPAEVRIAALHVAAPTAWIDRDVAPEHPQRGEVYIDAAGQPWRAIRTYDDHGHPALAWQKVDLVSASTRARIRALIAGSATASVGLFLLGPALLTLVGAAWGWPLLILCWLAMIAAILTLAGALESHSHLVVLNDAHHQPRHLQLPDITERTER